MTAALTWKWMALVLGAAVLSTGCLTVTPPTESGLLLERDSRASAGLPGTPRSHAQDTVANSTVPARLIRRRGEDVHGTRVAMAAMASPAEIGRAHV